MKLVFSSVPTKMIKMAVVRSACEMFTFKLTAFCFVMPSTIDGTWIFCAKCSKVLLFLPKILRFWWKLITRNYEINTFSFLPKLNLFFDSPVSFLWNLFFFFQLSFAPDSKHKRKSDFLPHYNHNVSVWWGHSKVKITQCRLLTHSHLYFCGNFTIFCDRWIKSIA